MESPRIQETTFSNATVIKKPRDIKTNHPGLGFEYEVLLPAYLALRFFKNTEIKDFRLRSNVQSFDLFDDLVIDIAMENGSKHHFALQLKHKENKNFKLTLSSFTFGKDFNLEKYCKAYRILPDEFNYVIYTNANVDTKKIKDVKNFEIMSCGYDFVKGFLDTSDGNDNVYRFEVNKNTTQEHDFENFFQHFSLFVSQKNSQDLEKEIKNIFKIEYAAKDEKIATEYIDLFRKWHKRQFTNNVLNRKMLSIHLVDLFLGHFMVEPSKGIINRDEKLRLLEESIRMFDVTIIEDSELKLVEELGKYEDEYCLPSYIHKILGEYAKDFKTDWESVILRLAKEYKFIDKFAKELESVKKLKIFNYLLGKPLIINYNEISKHQISKVLQMDFKENIHIKFVLVGNEIDSKQFNNLKSFYNLQDLCNCNNDLYQRVINEIDISLQGREKIKLKKIITSDEELAKTIQVKHLFQENLIVGEDLEELPEFYIPRTVSAAVLDEDKVLKYFYKENYYFIEHHLVMIDYGAEEEYVKSFAQRNSLNMINVEEFINKRKNPNTRHKWILLITLEQYLKQNFEQICFMTNRNVHFLKINKPGEFLLIKSKNSNTTENLSQFYIKETEIPFYFSKGVNVLCAEPGMGKTTTMKTIRNSCSSDYWTIFVELKQFDYLFKKNNLETHEILDHLLNKFKQDVMSRKVQNIFLIKKKIAFFLDGLDEVNYQSIDNVLEFVKKLKQEGFFVWVASRNNLSHKIETELNQFSINLTEITEEQQRQYITNRLCRDNKYSQDKINGIITSILNSIKNNSILFLVTQVFIESINESLELNESFFVLTNLYENYFNGKIKNTLMKCGLVDEWMFKRIAKATSREYQIPGLKSCLSNEDFEKIKLHPSELKMGEEFIDEITIKSDEYGIIKDVNEKRTITFVHQIFGEYFAAIYLSEHFDKVQILGESFLTEKYDNLRLLFDIKLAENNPLHLSIIHKNLDQFYEHVVNFNSKDRGDRTPLHIACTYGTRYSPLEYKQLRKEGYYKVPPNIKKENDIYIKMINILIDGCPVFQFDQIFNWSEIKYGLNCWCLYPVELIFKKCFSEPNLNSAVKNLIKNMEDTDKDSLVYYAVRFGYENLLTALFANHKFSINKLKYNGNQQTLLHIACVEGHYNVVLLLINNKAKVNVIDLTCYTPLHYACKNGHKEIARLLIKNNSDINSIDEDGKTPLHDACLNGYYETVKLLLENNANINSIDKDGKTPLDDAYLNRHNETVKLLIKNMANGQHFWKK